MDAKTNTTVSRYFWVYSGTTPVPGLQMSDFMRGVFKDGVASTVAINVFEVNASTYPGLYRSAFVPDQSGSWYTFVKHSSYTISPAPSQDAIRVLDHDVDDIFSGLPQAPSGSTVLVGTDYGGTDNLRYTDLKGTGIADATVWAYFKDDWDAGTTGRTYVKSWTKTDLDGKLDFPLVLSSGYWYTIVYYRVGAPDHDVKELYVS